MLRRPGSSWGIGALLKGLTSVVVLKVERALVIHSPHRQFLPDLGIEPATFGLQVQLSNHKATAAPQMPPRCPPVMFFFSKYVYKNYLNVLIELWPNPGLV